MDIHIRTATEADVPEIATLNIRCFQDTGVYRNGFAGVEFPRCHAWKACRTYQKLASGDEHVVVGVEPSSGKVVAAARWAIPKSSGFVTETVALSEETTEEVNRVLDQGPPGRQSILDGFFDRLKEQKRAHTTEEDFVLDFLITSPEHQGKGIGKQMLKWGLDKADAVNARVYVEATEAGYPLYLKFGWRTREESLMDFGPLGGEGTQMFYLMIRERKTPQP